MTLSYPCENCMLYATCNTQVNEANKVSYEKMIETMDIIYKKCCLIRYYLQTYHCEFITSGFKIDCRPMIEYFLKGTYVIPRTDTM